MLRISEIFLAKKIETKLNGLPPKGHFATATSNNPKKEELK